MESMFLALGLVFERAQSLLFCHLLPMDFSSGVEFKVVHQSYKITLG